LKSLAVAATSASIDHVQHVWMWSLERDAIRFSFPWV